MSYGKTIDSRGAIPKELSYEMIRFQTFTGRSYLISDRGYEKKYGYRNGIETPIGDIEESLWCELMMELIKKNGETELYAQLLEWHKDDPCRGTSKHDKELHALQLFSYRIFDNPGWVDYIPFNKKFRPKFLPCE